MAESVAGCVQKGGRMLVEEQPGCTVGPGPPGSFQGRMLAWGG